MRTVPRIDTLLVPLTLGVAFSVPVAVSLAQGRLLEAAAVAAVPITVVAAADVARRVETLPRAHLLIGTVTVLLLASTLVWRARGTDALNENPLDVAASTRVVLVAVAFFISLGVITQCGFRAGFPMSLKLLAAYVVLSAIAAIGSPHPFQAGYRTFELLTGLVALAAGYSVLGDRAGKVIVDTVFGFFGVISVLIWLEAIALPNLAWHEVSGSAAFGIQLTGVLPSFASNTVGTIGALIALRGLTIESARTRWIVTVWGLLTLIASQERTGVVGFVLGAVAIAVIQRQIRLAWFLAAGLIGLALTGALGNVTGSAQTAFERGQTYGNYRSLSGRTYFWSAARPLVEERPWLGWGLNVGSRKALAEVGRDQTSTIHGAWMEAALGVGIPGLLILAAALLTTLRDSLRARDALGAAVVLFFLIRSITGTSVELFGLGFVLFGGIALLVTRPPSPFSKARP